MRKTIKIILVLICISLVISGSGVYAWGLGGVKPSGEGTETVRNSIGNVGAIARGIISTVGVVVSIMMLVIIGMKYMLGSVEEKSQYKKTLLPYVIGAGIVFSGTVIPTIIYNIIYNISTQK